MMVRVPRARYERLDRAKGALGCQPFLPSPWAPRRAYLTEVLLSWQDVGQGDSVGLDPSPPCCLSRSFCTLELEDRTLGNSSVAAGRRSESGCGCLCVCRCVCGFVSSFAEVLPPVGVLRASPLGGDLAFVFYFLRECHAPCA